MNDTQALLEFIYKNAEMGKKTLDPIKDYNDNTSFRKELDRLLENYTDTCRKADELLRLKGLSDASGLNIGEKMMTEMSLRMNTLTDRSVPHLADMLLKGASMGVTDIAKKLEEYSGADEDAKELARQLLKLNSDTIDNMKGFLTAV